MRKLSNELGSFGTNLMALARACHVANTSSHRYQSWSPSSSGASAPSPRSMYAPLYLDVSDILGVETFDHYYFANV